MDSSNPFSPPRASLEVAPAVDLGPPWWIEGTMLIVRKRTKLPDICVRTGKPAATRFSHELPWTPMWFKLLAVFATLIALLTYSTIRRTGTIEFAMSAATARRRRLGLMIAFAAAFGTMLLMFLSSNPAARFGVLLLGALVLFGAVVWSRPFRILTIDRFHVRLRLTPQAARAFAAAFGSPAPGG